MVSWSSISYCQNFRAASSVSFIASLISAGLLLLSSFHRHRNRIGENMESACAQTGLNISNQGQTMNEASDILSSLFLYFTPLSAMFTELCTIFATVELLCLMYRQLDNLNNSELQKDDDGLVLHKKYYQVDRQSSPFWNNL